MDLQVLKERFCEYGRYWKGFSPATLRRYKYVLELFIRNSGVTRLEDMTADKVRAFFFDGRTRCNWSPATFRTYHKSLVAFFKFCQREGLSTANPMADLEKPKLARTIPPKLARDQALRLLEAAKNWPYASAFLRARNHAILATFVYAGLRKQELLKLQFADVDIANLSLFVRRGKGAKDRIVPICLALAGILRTYTEERAKMRRTCPEFFVSSTHNVAFSETGLKHLIADVRHASGITFTAHRLRHTFATLMLEGGCDIYSLSRMLGHSDISTTTIYLAASAELLRAQITKHPLNLEAPRAMNFAQGFRER